MQSRPASIWWIGLLWALALGGQASIAHASDLIDPGAQPKISAGAGQTVSRGATSLFYNPANLISSKFMEAALDVSVAQVTYTYQHTNTEKFDPVKLAIVAPPVTLGLAMRPIDMLAFGVAVLPTGTGQPQKIPAVPLEIQPGIYQPLDIVQKDQGVRVAAGAALRFAFPFTLGVGVIHYSEKTQTTGTELNKTDPFLDIISSDDVDQFTVGVRSELVDRYLVFALSYKTAVTKKYKGDLFLNLDPGKSDYVPFTGVGYIPASIGGGVEFRVSKFGMFAEVVDSQWSAGRKIVKRGMGAEASAIDLVDTIDVASGVKFWFMPKHIIQVAAAMRAANIGDGSLETTDQTNLAPADNSAGATAETIGGVTFGALDAIPRMIAAGGYHYRISGHGNFIIGGQYQTGTRKVPEGYAGTGTYTLQVLMGTAALTFGF